MASSKQVSANRKNAQKNTGPKSVEAKKSVRLNALRHGLSAAAPIFPSENQAEFDHLEAQFTSEYPPESGLEGFFLDQMIACAWRLRRVAKVESDVFRHFQAEIDNPPARIVGIAGVSGFDDPAYEGEAAGPDNWQDAGAPTFITAPSAPPAVAATPGQAFLKASTEADLFAKIDRHEATIRAGFYRAFYELQRLRAARDAGTTLQN